MKSVTLKNIIVHILPALSDNYIYVIEWIKTKQAIVIDPAEAQPVIDFCTAQNLSLTHILNTHHHHDHIGGNAALKNYFDPIIIAPAYDTHRISPMDIPVRDGDHLKIHDIDFNVISCFGHTMGHIVFHAPQHDILFCGDVLFGMGCGRVFEGTMQDMFLSLKKIKSLPPKTQIFCGHEYTLSNAIFSVTYAPDDDTIKQRARAIKIQRDKGEITIPFTLQMELETNLFLRADTVEDFSAVRAAKNNF